MMHVGLKPLSSQKKFVESQYYHSLGWYDVTICAKREIFPKFHLGYLKVRNLLNGLLPWKYLNNQMKIAGFWRFCCLTL